jgi:hypothetical protein
MVLSKRGKIAHILVIIVIFIAVAVFFLLPGHAFPRQYGDWTVSDQTIGGADYRVEEAVVDSSLAGRTIKVYTLRQYLHVHLDGELLLSYEGGADGAPSRGLYFIETSPEDAGKTLRILYSSPYAGENDIQGTAPSVEVQRPAPYDIDYYLGAVCMVLGISLVVVAIVLNAAKITAYDIWLLTAGTLLYASCMISTSHIHGDLSPQALYYIYWISFWLYPPLLFTFMFFHSAQPSRKILFPVLMAVYAYALVCFLLDVFGAAPINRYGFWYTYICFVMLVFVLVLGNYGRDTNIPRRYAFTAIFCIWAVWGVSLGVRLGQPLNNADAPLEFKVIIAATVLALVVYNLVAYTGSLVRMRNNETYMKRKEESLLEKYRDIEQHLDDASLLRHEMKHHFATLQMLYKDERYDELGKYLDSTGKYYGSGSVNICGNYIVNAVVGNIMKQAKHLGIRFGHDCSMPRETGIDEAELASLLLNALENALEASSRVEDTERRFIDIAIKYENNFLLIKVSNGYKEVREKNGSFATTKKDGKGHGFGLRVLKRIVRLNGGDMDISAKDGIFTLQILLNIKN